MTPEQIIIHQLSERLVNAQAPIRILDSIKWNDAIKREFFQAKCKNLPRVNAEYYTQRTLDFDIEEKQAEFNQIIRDTRNQLGQYSSITQLIERRCLDYITAVQMIAARGTKKFSLISKQLYGDPDDAFYAGGPTLSQLGTLLGDILANLSQEFISKKDDKIYNAQQVIEMLQPKFANYFHEKDKVLVEISDDIIADAAAGADCIKINSKSSFSKRDIKYLEVHEGWVHVGTTINGLKQPYCTFLAKGSPASTITQEGLAVITEIFAFSSYPERVSKLTNRLRAINMANQGANFIEVYNFFIDQDYQSEDAYNYSTRVFRGSTPELGPFTKDLSYTKGFVLLYNYIRLAAQKGQMSTIPLLFCGKVLLDEIPLLAKLVEQGLVTTPEYLPPQFRDLSALSAWMSFSLYLNKFDLQVLADQYRFF